MIMFRKLAVLSGLLLLSACASQGIQQPTPVDGAVTAGSLLTASPLGDPTAGRDLAQLDMLAMSPEMAEFVESRVKPAGSQSEQLKQLADAVMRSGEFSLAYEDTTGTAAETFESRRGNCMAFTNMFVTMARYLGLDAGFQEVEVPPTWSKSGDSFLYSQHINVYIDLKQGRWREVDFNIYDFDHDMETRMVSDSRARAHYFNNVGAELMLEGETGPAYAHFRQSLFEDIAYRPAWINLGVLHRREGLPEYAEAAFVEALRQGGARRYRLSDQTFDVGWMPSRTDVTSLLAMSNLASLYEEQGRSELAAQYFYKVHSHRMKNPYYRYEMAQLAFAEGDYQSAIDDLKFAIRRHRNESEFYYLLSFSYMMEGNDAVARKWMKKAGDIAEVTGDQERYSYKLDLLRSLGN